MKLKVMSMIFSALMILGVAHADSHRNDFNGEAVLATAVSQPSETSIKGIMWRCEATNCSATAPDWPGLDSFAKQCKTVARELGTLTKFRSRGRVATKQELGSCNQVVQDAKK